MAYQDEVQAHEEALRTRIRALPDAQRSAFFHALEPKLKDPDTYAALNYLFIAGLHHFYLGKWLRGLCNITIFIVGILLLWTPLAAVGVLIILGITAAELYALFRAQTMVQAHNNDVMEQLYQHMQHDISQQEHAQQRYKKRV